MSEKMNEKRLIYAEDLKNALRAAGTPPGRPYFLCRTVFECIDNVETVDAEPIVRCRDCEWWEKQEESIQGRCALSGAYPSGSWYCANAKKSKGEEIKMDEEEKE